MTRWTGCLPNNKYKRNKTMLLRAVGLLGWLVEGSGDQIPKKGDTKYKEMGVTVDKQSTPTLPD